VNVGLETVVHKMLNNPGTHHPFSCYSSLEESYVQCPAG